MPTLGAPLDLSKYEARNLRAHILSSAPASPVTGQMYYNSGDNTLYWWDGAIWQSAKGGAPGGSAGGDLSGTYPNPQIAAGVIVDADINAAAGIQKSKLGALNLVNADIAAGAAIAYAKLALTGTIVNADVAAGAAIAYAKLALTAAIVNADIAAGAGIVYSKLNLANSIVNADISATAAIALSKLATDPLARANHTGTQLAATISDFNTARDAQRLDQHAAPTAAVALNGQKITGLADGTASTDAVTKQQLDAVSAGLEVKQSVRVLATTTVTISSPGANIDGVAMASGNRVLLAGQGGNVTTPHSANGIYVWNGAAVAMTRATDADTSAEVTSGLFTFVEEGTSDNSGWVLATNNPITLGTTALQFVQFSGAGQITDGAGLLKTGNTLDVNPDNSTVEVVGDQVRVKDAGITNAKLAGSIDATTKLTGAVPVINGGTGQTTAKTARETGLSAAGYYSALLGAVTGGAAVVVTQATHLLRAARGILVQVAEEATGMVVLPDISIAANGDVSITFGASQAANFYRVTLVG